MHRHTKKDIDVKTNIFLPENFKYIAGTRDMNIKLRRKQQYESLVKCEEDAYSTCVCPLECEIEFQQKHCL